MRGFEKEKSLLRRVFESGPFLLALCLLFGIFFFSMFDLWKRAEATKRNKNEAREAVAELELARARLSSDIHKLTTDRGLEENIRGKLGLGRPGEGVIIIVPEEALPEALPETGFARFLSAVKGWFK